MKQRTYVAGSRWRTFRSNLQALRTMVPMKILYNERNSIWLQVLLLVCVARMSTVTGQDGFLSIDCGSDKDYIDDVSGISWVKDSPYVLTGTNINNISVKTDDGTAIPSRTQMESLRYFDDPRNRDCYLLPVDTGETYLVRATFFYGSLGNPYANPISFNVSMDNNIVYHANWDASVTIYQSYSFETIYSAPRSPLDLCLIRDEGPSFISALELRKLDRSMYTAGTSLNQYMLLWARISCGFPQTDSSPQIWRYPNDTYDRIWNLTSKTAATPVSNPTISKSTDQLADLPPLVVMQDGWVNYGFSLLVPPIPVSPLPLGAVYTAAYFQELDGNASAINVRGMDYFLNGNFIRSFNTSETAKEVSATWNITGNSVNMSFVQTSWSSLPPMLNAFEVYQLLEYNSSTTADEDVSALYALQIRLNLTSWKGDPCLPAAHAFDWLSCSDDLRPRITHLFLANYGFGGSFPQEISSLTALTVMELNNNSFYGPIADFSNLRNLQSVHLQDNYFNGTIPGFLGEFPNLSSLILNNNNLSGTVPSNLDKPGLNLTFANNPKLKIPPWYGSPTKSHSIRITIGAVVGGILGGLVLLAVVAGIVWTLATKKSRARSKIIRDIGHAEKEFQGQSSGPSIQALGGSMRLLSLREVSQATKKFSKKIGEGSFGPVYYGTLPNGLEVAVKVKSTDSRQGAAEFLNEVELLSRIHHRNLVSLVGYCNEGNQQILIYVYVSNGTLRDHLYGDTSKETLPWRTRLNIALNAAKGIKYLHMDCNPGIIHRDVKSANILLGEKMVAKVADFGISKQTPEGTFSGVDTMLKGTPGYLDPEYFSTQRLTQKSDVYSFGVVLLEIISGRHPHISDFPDGTTATLVQWVFSAVNNGTLMDIVDPALNGEFNEESMAKVIILAVQSIDNATATRPDMRQVERTLTEALELELFEEILQKIDNDSIPPFPEDEDPDYADFNGPSLPGSMEGPGHHP